MNYLSAYHILQMFLMIFSGTVIVGGLIVIMMEPMIDE